MKSQNILYVGGFELPDGNAAAQRVIANAKAIRAGGNNIVFLGVDKKGSYDSPFTEQGFTCYYVNYPKSLKNWFNYLFSITKIKQIIKIEKIDAIICYNYQAFAFYRLLKYARANNLKIYGDVTEWYEVAGNVIFKSIKSIDTNLRMKFLHCKVDGLIVISDFLQDYYSKRGQKNIVNVPPLVDITDTKWKELKTDSCPSFYRFIYAGSPGSGNKDKLDIVVNSLKEINFKMHLNLQFDIVGITEDQYILNFNNSKPLDGQYDFIKFHGRITHQEAIMLLREANFSIFLREDNLTNRAGFPTKFTESVTAGTTIITNPSSNIEKYITEDPTVGFLLKELSKNYLYLELERIVAEAKKNSFGQIRNKVRRTFDYSNYITCFKTFLK